MRLLPAIAALAVAVLAPMSPRAADPAPPPPAALAPAAISPAPPSAAPAATRGPEEAYSGYVALKGGGFNSTGEYQGSSFDNASMWELAAGSGLGAGKLVGFEVSTGSATTTAGNLKVKTIPIQLGLRLHLPIAFVVPYGEVGVGAYFNRFTNINTGTSEDGASAGWFAGLGCDLLLGRLLLGAQIRYVGVAAAVTAYGSVVLDRYEGLLLAGIRY